MSLFEKHKALAIKLAKRHCWDNYYLPDMQQEAFLALWEASVEYDATDGYEFSSAAYYKIMSALRAYSNTFFNVVSIPQKEAASRRKYVELLNLLEFNMELIGTCVDSQDIALVWEHPIEKELSEDMQERIRAFKERISYSKSSYVKTINRFKNGCRSSPLRLHGVLNISVDAEYQRPMPITDVLLDLTRYRESLNINDRVIFELKIQGMNNEEASIVLDRTPRSIKTRWSIIRKQIALVSKNCPI